MPGRRPRRSIPGMPPQWRCPGLRWDDVRPDHRPRAGAMAGRVAPGATGRRIPAPAPAARLDTKEQRWPAPAWHSVHSRPRGRDGGAAGAGPNLRGGPAAQSVWLPPVEGLVAVFSGKGEAKEGIREEEVEKLHAKIGQLVVERDFLAKASGR